MSTQYNATAEINAPPDEATAAQLLDALNGYHPAVGRSPFARTEATITLPAETLAQATTTALAILTVAAAPHELVALEVLPTADFDRRQNLEPIPELVSVTQAAEELGVTRQAVLQRIDAGSIPATRIGSAWAIPQSALVSLQSAGQTMQQIANAMVAQNEPMRKAAESIAAQSEQLAKAAGKVQASTTAAIQPKRKT